LVLLRVFLNRTAGHGAALVMFRKNGTSNSYNSTARWLEDGEVLRTDLFVMMDANRKVEYYFEDSYWTAIQVTVGAYWQ